MSDQRRARKGTYSQTSDAAHKFSNVRLTVTFHSEHTRAQTFQNNVCLRRTSPAAPEARDGICAAGNCAKAGSRRGSKRYANGSVGWKTWTEHIYENTFYMGNSQMCLWGGRPELYRYQNTFCRNHISRKSQGIHWLSIENTFYREHMVQSNHF